MKETKEIRTNKGITLIALVITIIVMLILVGVTISMAVNGGLFDYAGKATGETKNALNAEQGLAKGGIEVDGTWYNSIDEYLIASGNKEKPVEKISKTESYVGCYADVDADGIVDGVIYADLAFEKIGQLEGDYTTTYIINKQTTLKDYYVSGTYEGKFGTKEILTATGEGNDRFYVMALSYVGRYTWYESKGMSGININTSDDFGTGNANTQEIIKIWNADTDEAKNSNDIWGQIQTQVSKGWFVPSRAECAAYVVELNSSNESSFWSSSQSQGSDILAWVLYGNYGMDEYDFQSSFSVCLSITF